MTMPNQTNTGFSENPRIGKGNRIVGVAVDDAWGKNNAFQLGRNFLYTLFSFSLWVAIGAGLVEWADSGASGWFAWAGVIMLGISFLFPVALLVLYIRVANAGVMVRVYKPLSREWMKAGDVYRNPSLALIKYVIVYTLSLPFILVKDVFRVVRFVFSKLAGRNVKFGSARDVFNVRLIAELNKAAKTLGPEKADHLHYLTWRTMEMPPQAESIPSYDDWRAGLRKRVVDELHRKYGPILTT